MYAENRILNNLSIEDKQRLRTDLALIKLKTGEALLDSNMRWRYVYFPIDCIISLNSKNDDFQYIDFALIGNEGMAGASVFLGDTSNEYHAKVEHGGKAFCLPISAAINEASKPSQLRMLILSYLQALVKYSLQMAICERKHSTLQRLSHTLLACDDRLSGGANQLSQKWFAKAISSTDNEIALAIEELKSHNLVHTLRGQISITNRSRLAKRSCECYGLVKDEFNRLLPGLKHPIQKD